MGYGEEYEDDRPSVNSGAVVVKSVLKSALKWGAIGAAVGIAAIAVLSGGMFFGLPFVGKIIAAAAAYVFHGTAASLTTSLLTNGLMWGGALGAAAGGLVSLSNAGETVEAERDAAQARLDNYRMRRESNALLAHQHELQAIEMQKQAQEAGISAPTTEYALGPQGMGNERGA